MKEEKVSSRTKGERISAAFLEEMSIEKSLTINIYTIN